MNACDLILENATVLTIDPVWTVHERGFVAISKDRIAATGGMERRSDWKTVEAIDCSGGILMPGFVNTHTHVAMAAFRGAGEDIPDRLAKYIFPLEKRAVNRDLVYRAARFCLAEMARSGTTTFADMYYFEDEVARAAAEAGMRCLAGETIVDFPAPDAPEPCGGLEYARRFIGEWRGHGLVTPCFAPHAPYTVDAGHLAIVRAEAGRLGVPVLSHVAETLPEHERFTASHGSVLRYLDSIGFLFPGLVAAHMIHVDGRDIDLASERGIAVAHCPASNAKSGRPICPAGALVAGGVRLGLGTDGPISGNGMDMQGVVGLYPKLQKVRAQDRATVPAREAVRAATAGGAEALGLGRLTGSLEPGKKADLILVDIRSFNIQPVYDLYAAVAYGMRPHDVGLVLVDGRIICDRNGMRGFDEAEAMEDMARLARSCRDIVGAVGEARR